MSTKVYKIAVIGDGGTGKTTLIKAKCEDIFDESSKMTIGIDFAVIPFNKEDSTENDNIEDLHQILEESLKDNDSGDNSDVFGVFDFGGQKRFHFIHDAYLRGVKAAIILYDLTRFQTFDNIRIWHSLLQKEDEDIPIIIVGTKSDLVDDETRKRFSDYWDDIKHEFPNNDKIIDHIFVSAKNRQELNKLFVKLEIVTKELCES